MPFALKVEDNYSSKCRKENWCQWTEAIGQHQLSWYIRRMGASGNFKVSINPILQSQTYPLPTPEEMFSALANGESYTKLDLARAYKQMKVKEECQPLLTINTHCDLYRYTRLPFSITTAPSLWQQAMAQVLSGIPNAAYYIDDILITGRTRAEHIENLRMILCQLREYGLKLKHFKCEFLAKDLATGFCRKV